MGVTTTAKVELRCNRCGIGVICEHEPSGASNVPVYPKTWVRIFVRDGRSDTVTIDLCSQCSERHRDFLNGALLVTETVPVDR